MSWTTKRLLVIAALLLAAHLFAIFTLHTRDPILARIAMTGTPRRYFPTPPPASIPSPAEPDSLIDPLAFASANPRGFSGPAWMDRPKTIYATSNSIAQPKFLTSRAALTKGPDPLDPTPPATPLPFIQLAIPKTERQSTLAIDGPLAARLPASGLPTPPNQTAAEVLGNTTIQLGVQADGFPFSARIINGSGSRAADLIALRLAKQIRFAPGPTNLEWSDLTFQWFTEPPATNAVPK
jgi:outer membrane biosynthesis protein TonB